MLLIPAIDLKDGHCVRLKQGDMDQATVFSDDPAKMARHWLEQGARRLHLVDLNGAFAGKPVNQRMLPFIQSCAPEINNASSRAARIWARVADQRLLSSASDTGLHTRSSPPAMVISLEIEAEIVLVSPQRQLTQCPDHGGKHPSKSIGRRDWIRTNDPHHVKVML